MKRCGLYIRVSTDKQAKVEEGSLKAQNELLTRHIELKNKLGGEEWVVVDRYVDEGRSAKDTQGRPHYLRLMDDIRRGRINTVMCMALSRISRSTRDLLDMIEFFKARGVDFICLKEDFDTTTPQGKCFVTIMGALNEFEREQTSERTRLVMLARGERGLWHAGPILGYDRPPDKKGHLVPNPKEAAVVNAVFDTYLECGSILKACELLTANGYRTKEYITHEGRLHRARPFVYTSVQNLLTNLAYIGKREINKQWMRQPQDQLPESQRYKAVDGVWEPIVPLEKFNQVQALLRQNHEHNRNEVRPSRHFYLLNGGLLFCDACDSQMEGTAGTGKLGKIYYYYHCTNRRCGFRLPEGEVEQAVLKLLRAISQDDALLGRIVEKVNTKLKLELPKLSEQEKSLKCELAAIRAKADQLLEQYAEILEGAVFVKEKLASLEESRRKVEDALARLTIAIEDIRRNAIDVTIARKLFDVVQEVFANDLKAFQKRALAHYLLTRIEFSEKNLTVGIRADRIAQPEEALNGLAAGHVPASAVHPFFHASGGEKRPRVFDLLCEAKQISGGDNSSRFYFRWGGRLPERHREISAAISRGSGGAKSPRSPVLLSSNQGSLG